MKYIKLNNNKEYVSEEQKIIEFLGLDKVNILVGENNSGKSRFIRKLIESKSDNNNVIYDDNYSNVTKEENFDNYMSKALTLIKRELQSTHKEIYNEFIKELNRKDNRIDKMAYLHNSFTYTLKSIMNEKDYLESYIRNMRDLDYFKKTNIKDMKFYYIPILRGIENFEVYFGSKEKLKNIQMTMNDMNELETYIGKAKTIYSNKITSIYQINSGKVFTAEKLYDEIIEILLGEESKRELFHEFEKFIDDTFYNGEGFKINPNQSKNCLMVKIKQEPEYEIYNLGDGIKQLICLLYPIYMHKDEEYMFFIEEPEINLHPGFQRKFMEIILSEKFPNHTYYINTHSNHMIDLINEYEEVKIFKFKKMKDKKQISIVDNNYVTILNELGVRSSSVFLANCTIWVEGISDRIYLKKYLETYFKHKGKENIYKENIHYSFVEYAGGNLPHWNFDDNENVDEQINVSSISKNVFLIADNDNTAEKPNSRKHKRKQELKKILGENFYELKSREIENLISLPILEKTLAVDNNVEEVTRIKYLGTQWKSKYKQDIISNPKTHIGEFIDETFNVTKKYSDALGKTIKNKADFANKVCREINSIEDMTEEAVELIAKIYDFIVKSND